MLNVKNSFIFKKEYTYDCLMLVLLLKNGSKLLNGTHWTLLAGNGATLSSNFAGPIEAF